MGEHLLHRQHGDRVMARADLLQQRPGQRARPFGLRHRLENRHDDEHSADGGDQVLGPRQSLAIAAADGDLEELTEELRHAGSIEGKRRLQGAAAGKPGSNSQAWTSTCPKTCGKSRRKRPMKASVVIVWKRCLAM